MTTEQIISIEDEIKRELQKILKGRPFSVKFFKGANNGGIMELTLNQEIDFITLFELKDRFYLKRSGNYGQTFYYVFMYFKSNKKNN